VEAAGWPSPDAPTQDDLDEPTAPPLHGKTHPPADMDRAKPSLDDEVQVYHHPSIDAAVTEFGVDPDVADAAADLAGDLGATFLSGATRGQDMSDVTLSAEDAEESEVPLLLDEPMGEEISEEPVRRARVPAPPRSTTRARGSRPPSRGGVKRHHRRPPR